MKIENSLRLTSQFPSLFRSVSFDRTVSDGPSLPDRYSFECGDGWLALLFRLAEAIASHAKTTGLDVVATDVKEKFGMLRVYIENGDDEVDRLLDEAERESASICEICGEPGTLLTTGWCATRCDRCRHLR